MLPFVNLGEDGNDELFTKGVHADILTQVSKIRGLKVIARNSVERLDPTLGLHEIGRRLGVATVLEGGVQQLGNRIRVNVQLIDCQKQTNLWAETYDRELTAMDLFAIQRDIATSVAHALRATLSVEERAQIAAVPTDNLAAYQAYLLGQQHLAKRTSAALVEAVAEFQKAIALDPGLARAYVGLADSYQLQATFEFATEAEVLPKAEAAIDKALERGRPTPPSRGSGN